MNKIKVVVGGMALAAMVGAMLPISTAFAKKVDCSKVMDDINGGKSVKETAKDLHISKSSVKRCQKKAKAAGEGSMAAPAESAAPAAPAPAPAPAAPAAPAPMGSPAH